MATKMMGTGRRRFKKRNIFFFLTVLFLALNIQLFWYVDKRVEPILRDYANLVVTQIATDVIEKAVKEKIADNKFYRDILVTHKDKEGRIQSISFDSQAAGNIQAEITLQLKESLTELSHQKYEVPLGVALDNSILATLGPDIPITMIPEGAVEVELVPELTEKGINMVLLTINLEIKTIVKIIIPFSSDQAEIKHKVIVAQELIKGDVPSYYFDGGKNVPLDITPPAPTLPSTP